MTQLRPPSRRDPDAKPASIAGFHRAPRGPSRSRDFHEIDELVITVVLATMPLTYIVVRFGGFQLSGWAWLASLTVALGAVVTRPLDRRALHLLVPYSVFLAIALVSLLYTPDFFRGLLTLGQTSALLLVYLVAFRTPPKSRLRRRSLHLLAFSYASVGAALLIVGFPQEGADSISSTGRVEVVSIAIRPLSINLIALFLLVSALARSKASVVAAGVAGLVFTIGTGSRMAAAVLLLMILGSPRVFASWRARGAALLMVGVLAPVVLSLPAVQDRFFFGEAGGTLRDVLTLAPNVNTAGRRDLWPALIKRCENRAVTGYGIGASYGLSEDASRGRISHPHNDYIRTFCDTGIVGSAGIWWFMIAAGVRSLAQLRADRRHRMAGSALLATVAFILLAMTDNVLVYPAQFSLPVFVMLAWADQSNSSSEEGGNGSAQRPGASPTTK